MDDVLKDLLSALEEELQFAEDGIDKYKDGKFSDQRNRFYEYAKLKGYVWGMKRAIFLLKYRAEKAGIEVSQ